MIPRRGVALVLGLLMLVRPALAASDAPGGGTWVQAQGLRHWVKRAGRGTGLPVVVLHGGPGGNTYAFERTFGPRLERLAPVLYYHQRGSGWSEAPADPSAYSLELLVSDLEALRVACGLDRMVLFGFSFGGEVALAYAVAHPERVAGLVLSAPSVDFATSERILRTQVEGFRAVARGGFHAQVEAILAEKATDRERVEALWAAADAETVDRLLFHQPGTAARVRSLWKASGLTNSGQMMRALQAQPAPAVPLRERVRGLRMPALVLGGLHDRNLGPESFRDLAEALPNARLELFLQSAHFPEVEEPEHTLRAVGGFLRSLR